MNRVESNEMSGDYFGKCLQSLNIEMNLSLFLSLCGFIFELFYSELLSDTHVAATTG